MLATNLSEEYFSALESHKMQYRYARGPSLCRSFHCLFAPNGCASLLGSSCLFLNVIVFLSSCAVVVPCEDGVEDDRAIDLAFNKIPGLSSVLLRLREDPKDATR